MVHVSSEFEAPAEGKMVWLDDGKGQYLVAEDVDHRVAIARRTRPSVQGYLEMELEDVQRSVGVLGM